MLFESSFLISLGLISRVHLAFMSRRSALGCKSPGGSSLRCQYEDKPAQAADVPIALAVAAGAGDTWCFVVLVLAAQGCANPNTVLEWGASADGALCLVRSGLAACQCGGLVAPAVRNTTVKGQIRLLSRVAAQLAALSV